jgi:uncharacterized membrane protein
MSSESLATHDRTSEVAHRARGWVLAHWHVLVVWAAMLAWTAAVFAAVRSEYEEYQLGRFDLGNMVQAVWSTAHGRPLESTSGAGEQFTRLGSHVDPILVLLAPLWAVFPSPLTLAAAQVAAVSLGALPVFWLGRRHLASENAALILAVVYLAYPWLAWTALDAIHPVTFAIPLLLLAVWFLDTDRIGPFLLCAVLAASTGELMGITLAALGVWYALARGRRRAGLLVAVAGLAWTLVALQIVVPAFSGEGSAFYGFYDRVGGSPSGILRTAVSDPSVILSELFAGNVLVYVIALTVPLVGLFLLAAGLAAVALPALGILALADGAGPLDPRQHYLAAIIPFLVAATVLGIARLRPRDHVPVALTTLLVTVGMWAIFGPWSGAPAASTFWYQSAMSDRHVAALDRATALVPADAAVSASNRVGGHLSTRRHIYSFPVLGDAEWIVLDTHDLWLSEPGRPDLVERPPGHVRALAERLRRDARWAVVFEEDGVYVFRKLAART